MSKGRADLRSALCLNPVIVGCAEHNLETHSQLAAEVKSVKPHQTVRERLIQLRPDSGLPNFLFPVFYPFLSTSCTNSRQTVINSISAVRKQILSKQIQPGCIKKNNP